LSRCKFGLEFTFSSTFLGIYIMSKCSNYSYQGCACFWSPMQIKGGIKKLPEDKKGELNKSIKGPSPPPSPPPKNPCSPPPPASPCGNRCAAMATPPLSPSRPCDPKEKAPISPPTWPASPPKSPYVFLDPFLRSRLVFEVIFFL
jgi:hypothetical protein